MNYRSYGKLGFKVSALGMGCMRLPRVYHEDGTASVDFEKAAELIRYAAENGVNYFESAYTYHNGTSEAVLGRVLELYGLRGKVKIATKQPLAAMKTQDDIRRHLEKTLKKLRTDFIDVYLIHNIRSNHWDEIKRRKIIEEYERFKNEGLIGAIGFSYHGGFGAFRDILNYYNWDMCQVQQNMLDTDREVTEEAIALAAQKGTALVIMEPLKGGGLANAPESVQKIYGEYPVKRSPAQWAFRHLLNYPAVSTVLSGMTTMAQLKENIAVFSAKDAVPNCLSPKEKDILLRAKKAYGAIVSIPCTGCEYCVPCPQNVNIPGIFRNYNDGIMFGDFSQPKRAYMLIGQQFKASAENCTNCGACAKKCPQRLDVPKQLALAHEALKGWIE